MGIWEKTWFSEPSEMGVLEGVKPEKTSRYGHLKVGNFPVLHASMLITLFLEWGRGNFTCIKS